MKILCVIVTVHLIGAIACIIHSFLNKDMEFAVKNGDGIRYAKPSDIIIQYLLIWEILLLLDVLCLIEITINNKIQKHYK